MKLPSWIKARFGRYNGQEQTVTVHIELDGRRLAEQVAEAQHLAEKLR
jgi:hypothetical protein